MAHDHSLPRGDRDDVDTDDTDDVLACAYCGRKSHDFVHLKVTGCGGDCLTQDGRGIVLCSHHYRMALRAMGLPV